MVHAILAVAMQSRDQRLPSLDGLRAVSIALVLIAHCAGLKASFPLEWMRYTGEIGVFGVKIFFVISGFIITAILLEEYQRRGTISLRNFYLRRILRIFPAFYTFLIVVALLTLAHLFDVPERDFLHSATFTSNLFGSSWELLHTWSLSIEEQFYLVWPAILLLFAGRVPKWVLLFSAIAPPFLCAFVWHAHARLGDSVSALACGCLLACSRDQWAEIAIYKRLLMRSGTATITFLVLLALECARRFGIYAWLSPVISLSIAFLLDTVLSNPTSAAGRFLNWKPVVRLGLLSYSIYMWQQIFLNRWGTAWFNRFPAALLCALLCGALSFALIETPFLRLKSRLGRYGRVAPRLAHESQAHTA